jgi:hypothetical protein
MALSPAGLDWTDAENAVLVANYFAVLADEMAGRAFVKRRHNAAVVAEIGRTRGSVEVNIPRQSRGLYDVSRSKRLKTPLAWLLTPEGPGVASGNTRVFVTS